MTERSWMRMDLNLLKALHVLLEERSVARAADRFFVTRSAMSKTLQRLRETLNDPVLVRTAQGLVPTPRAEQLAASLATAIAHIEQGLASSARFDPRHAVGPLRIAAPETFAIGAMPRLLPALRKLAPQLRLESLHLTDDYQYHLTDGSIDFAIYFDQDYADGIIRHKLFSTAPMLWCRKDHPITRIDSLTLDDVCNYPKLAFHLPSIKHAQLLDVLQTMEQIEIGREVIFETSHLLVALVMLRQSDAVMIAPDHLFQDPAFSSTVTALPLGHIALFDELRFDLCLVQHQRTAQSALHQWMVAETVRAFGPAEGPASRLSTARIRALR